jgi:hypothetical protein
MEVPVRLRERLRTLLVCVGLQIGVMLGVPMRPEQIQELMHGMHQQKLAHVIPQEDRDDDE